MLNHPFRSSIHLNHYGIVMIGMGGIDGEMSVDNVVMHDVASN